MYVFEDGIYNMYVDVFMYIYYIIYTFKELI